MLDAAYPPRLAQSWDSVGLVCGDPADAVESVTVAVDATAAVVDEVPDGGLLLAHHPLLLRGVDTVAASTAKGALVHRLIRTGRALFTAHTNADSASPGVSDALADALGLTVDDVLEPVSAGADLDKWVVYVPAENAEAVRAAMFDAGAGQIGDYSHCSWSASGSRTVPAARRRVAGDRQRRHRRAGSRGPGRGDRAGAGCAARSWRRCGPPTRTRSPPSTSSRWRRCPAGVGLGRIGIAAEPGAVARFRLPRARRAARDVVGRARGRRSGADGVAGRGVRRCGRFAARHGRARGRAGLRHRRPAAPSRRRAPARIRRRAGRRRALGQRVSRGAPGRRPAADALRRRLAGAGQSASGPTRGISRETRPHESRSSGNNVRCSNSPSSTPS